MCIYIYEKSWIQKILHVDKMNSESDSELEDYEDLLYLLLLRKCQKKKKYKKRRFWVRNIFRQREVHGTFHTLFRELDRELFFRYHACNYVSLFATVYHFLSAKLKENSLLFMHFEHISSYLHCGVLWSLGKIIASKCV